MKFFKTRRGVVLLAVLVVAVAAAVGAYAFFVSTGSGTATGTVGSPANDLVITGTATGALLPGSLNNVGVDLHIANPDSFAQAASSISPDTSATSNGVTVTGGTNSHGGCLASWFHFYGDGTTPDSTLTLTGSPVEIAANPGHVDLLGADTGAMVGMDESGTDQSDCETATVTFHLVSG